MSANGTKRTFCDGGLESAFGGKADQIEPSRQLMTQSGHRTIW